MAGNDDTSNQKQRGKKFADVAMSPEVIAAGLAAAAAALAASPKARRKIQDATLDAADKANRAATETMTTATKMGAMIVDAVADAAQRILSGEWDDDDVKARQPTKAPKARPSKPAKTGATTGPGGTKAGAAKTPTAKKKAAGKTGTRKTATAKAKASSQGATRVKTAAKRSPSTEAAKAKKTSARKAAPKKGSPNAAKPSA